ncbi:hypothetical protein M422DRAFT_75313 [Sphaerobolus stellatus SS14]|uniref:Cytochrome c oxidase subunit 4 n=1 Tax=Sphaerobolus stellatus (strain SS14) TaxID=990650 RepID=A0A0C9VPU8_SPHS4|nr:hypothetical protein M422DRAFT_75313 [Sphaerobolus stellatus SS14]
MNAMRLARTGSTVLRGIRCASTIPHAHTTINGQGSVIPLSNVEAQWEVLSNADKVATALQLEDIQKKDWKELSLQEKKAIYYVAFGPHGPRTPHNPPGTAMKIIAGTLAIVTVSALAFKGIRSQGGEPPRTITKEWQEASNDIAIKQKADPISGIASEGYKGKGFVTADK